MDLKISNNCWSLIHENICSIPRNLTSFDNYLSTLGHDFSIIGLTETWLKEHNIELYGIDGYNSEHAIRKNKSGGGVSIFIQDTLEYFIRQDLSYQNDNIECIFIEIDKSQLKKDKKCCCRCYLPTAKHQYK